jgi:glycerol transport system ATP-binding protein
MARIELRGVAHSYGANPTSDADYALKPLDLVWENGGAYALLGPSGCGKSTLLGIISGLLRPTRGAVLMDGRDVSALEPRLRNVAQVFQFPVLYDTMTVYENLAFPLRNRGVSASETKSRVERIAGLLDLTSELRRTASGLPGDLKQRISLGRGLVRKDVAAILLDEPLTVIDPHLRWHLRRKLMEIHAELNVTLIYVTHDQLEALTLADEVVVMSDGAVLQQGTPQALFERPEHTFVGHFIGSPGMNLMPMTMQDGAARIAGQSVSLPSHVQAAAAKLQGEFQLGVRPEFLSLAPQDNGGPRIVIERLAQLGGFNIVGAKLGEQIVQLKTPPEEQPAIGAEYWLELPDRHTHLYRSGRIVDART